MKFLSKKLKSSFSIFVENPLLFLIAGFFLVTVFPIYSPLVERFTARDSYYSHGFLIPFITIYLIWRKRGHLKSIQPVTSMTGLFLLISGLFVFIVSRFFVVNFVSYLGSLIALFGIILFLFGWRLVKEIFLPLAFLIFMLPLPSIVVIGITFKMKMIASIISSYLANMIGIQAEVSGSKILYPGGSLLVGDPCSGLRSMISFLALGAFLIQVINTSILKKILIFISVMPIAILSNVMRILVLTVVCYIYGDHLADGLLHDATGIMVFIVGFIGLMFVLKVLKCQISIESV